VITTVQTILFLVLCELRRNSSARSKADAYLMLFSRPIKSLLWLMKPVIHFSMRVIDMLKKEHLSH
jgi:CBS domain containing-hemolysin-like protein